MFNRLRSSVLLVAALSAGALGAGCGPSQASVESGRDCFNRCLLEYMTCVEAQTCVDVDGQVTPCEGQCQEKQAQCEQACGQK